MLTVKKANKNDLLMISAMDVSTEKDNQNQDIQIADSTQAWLNWIENTIVFKAIDDDRNIVGIIVVLPVNNHGYCIHKLLISNDSSLKPDENIATLLLERFLVKIDKHEDKAYVIVPPNDSTAIERYIKHGFNKQTLHPEYLGENEDHLMMSRSIKWSDIKTNNVLPLNKISSSSEATKNIDSNLFLKSMNFNNYRVR